MPSYISNTIQAHLARWNSIIGIYEFLVLKRSNDVRIYPGIWQVITGTIEENETALQSVIREIKEETSIEAVNIWVLPYVTQFFNISRDAISASAVFGILVNEEETVKLSTEHTEFQWLDYKSALEKIVLESHNKGMSVFLEQVLLGAHADLFKVHLEKYSL